MYKKLAPPFSEFSYLLTKGKIKCLFNSFNFEKAIINESTLHKIKMGKKLSEPTKKDLEKKGLIKKDYSKEIKKFKNKEQEFKSLYLLLTNRCNYNCNYCFINKKMKICHGKHVNGF